MPKEANAIIDPCGNIFSASSELSNYELAEMASDCLGMSWDALKRYGYKMSKISWELMPIGQKGDEK